MKVKVHPGVIIAKVKVTKRAYAKIFPVVLFVTKTDIVAANDQNALRTKEPLLIKKQVTHDLTKPKSFPLLVNPPLAVTPQAKTWKPNLKSNVNVVTNQPEHYEMNENFKVRLENELELGYPENCQEYET